MITAGLDRPVDIQPANDGTGRLFIIEKYGAIRILENGQLLNTPFLNISDRVDDSGNEMGLLGLAFHPEYSSTSTTRVTADIRAFPDFKPVEVKPTAPAKRS